MGLGRITHTHAHTHPLKTDLQDLVNHQGAHTALFTGLQPEDASQHRTRRGHTTSKHKVEKHPE